MPLLPPLADFISRKSRAKKFTQFLETLSPEPHETILDVGVNAQEYSPSDNYLEKHYHTPEKITAVGLGDMSAFEERYPKVTAVSADGTHLPFQDNAFDIAFSNAVLEHVGSRLDQTNFLKELYRVSRRGYLTTPNRHFPIEIHTRIPLLHLLLPKKYFDRVATLLGKSWATGDYMFLLSKKDLEKILLDAGVKGYTLIKNRFFGFTMTFTVTWKKP